MISKQIFYKDNFAKMHSIHDSVATRILIKERALIIEYDNLDESVIGRDFLPYYKGKKLTVEYDIDSFCEAKFFSKNKYKIVDLLDENATFYKLMRNCTFVSYKYAVNCFDEITLFFDIRGKNKYWNFEISMDAQKVTYNWE